MPADGTMTRPQLAVPRTGILIYGCRNMSLLKVARRAFGLP